MRKTYTALAIVILSLSAGCSDFLDVNTNPNGPQSVSANLYLPPMLHWLVTSPQLDGRFIGHYAQEWYSTTTNASPPTTWGKMGYDPGSDNGAQQWRDVYWSLGQNLVDMNNKATAEQRWDLLGVGLILKAWGWQVLTDLHGEIIVKEAIDQSRTQFDYDSQDYAYQEVQRLLDSAIVLLKRTDGAVDQTYLAVGDHIYNGDRTKWLKLAAGLLALNLNHYSNKTTYDPARVIRLVDSSFTSNADDALLGYPCTSTDFADCNFWGRTRNNITLYRQTQFIVGLMNGTQFGGTVDPRMSHMLAAAPDGQYRGLDPNVSGFGAITVAAQQPNNFFGYTGTGGLGLPSRYIFADRSKLPVMTYSELQFIKAEAAFRMGNQPTALTAYTNGIRSHFQF
ncbi:MAG: hypothetical protein AUI63_05720, partial [Gemmatimonadetes bacterium 13_1_40CM_2_60_3]